MLRYFFRFFLPSFLIVGLIAWAFYANDVRSEKQLLKAHDTGMVEQQKQAIASEFDHVVSDLLFLAHQAEFHDVIVKGEWSHLARHYLVFSSKKRVYDQVRFIDAAGMERVRVNYNNGKPSIVMDDKLQQKGHRYYFQDTIKLSREEIFISAFDLNIEHGSIEQPLKPMVRFGTPVLDHQGNKHGVIVLNYLGKNLIKQLALTHATDSKRSLLLNAEGYWLYGAPPENAWGFMFADRKDKTFARAFPQEWQQITAADAGQFQTGNGLYTFTTVYPLQEAWKSSNGSVDSFMSSSKRVDSEALQWKVVSHRPQTELLAETRRLATRTLQLSTLLILLLAIGSWQLAKARVRRKQDEKALIDSQCSLNEAQRIALIGNWDLDLITNRLFWSEEIYRMFEIDPKKFGASYEAFLAAIHPDDRERVSTAYTDSVENKIPYEIEHRLLMPDGSLKWVHEHCETFYNDTGEPIRSIGTVQDITERKKNEQALRRSSRLIQTIERLQSRYISHGDPFTLYSDLLKDTLILSGSDYGFIGEVLADSDEPPYLKLYALSNLSWDNESKKLYGAVRDNGFEFRNLNSLIGRVISSGRAVISNNPVHDPRRGGLPEGHPAIDAFVGIPIYCGDKIVGEIGLANRKGGYDQVLLDYMAPLITACGQIIVARQDQVARRIAEKELENLASMDGLLHIPNRRHFNEYLEQEWRRALRYKTPISLFMIDIDYFKLFNDNYGHQAGDDCLVKIAKLIHQSLRRPTDMAARYGGEEFVCILPDTALEGAIPVAKAMMRHVLEEQIMHATSPVSDQVTLSIGIATALPGSMDSSTELIAQADQLLYEGKASGRNRTVTSEGIITL